MTANAPPLGGLLDRHRDALRRYLEKHGSGLLRYESVSDLVQGVHLHALSVEQHFEYRGEPEFRAWMERIARQHVADRFAYWLARKRCAGKLLRITSSDLTRGDAAAQRSDGVHPAGKRISPNTIAELREDFRLAMKAIELLPPRDRELIECCALELSVREIAERLHLTHDAAERARLRALDRFKKIFRGLAGGASS